MKKNKKMNFITLLTLTISPIMVFSCRNSWTKWSMKKNISPQIKYDTPMAEYEEQYKVKDLEKKYSIITSDEKAIVYLDKINNQYELVKIIIKILQISPEKTGKLDTFWNDLNNKNNNIKMSIPKYFKKIRQKILIEFHKNKKIFEVEWDISNITKKIKEIYEKIIINKKKYKPKFNFFISKIKNPLNEDGIPERMLKIPSKDINEFLDFKSIEGLMEKDLNFALKLSKLFNLPENAFNEIKKWIKKIDELWINIYKNIKGDKWIDSHKLKINKRNKQIIIGINFAIQKNGKINKDFNKYNILKELLGIFIINSLKGEN